VQIWDVDTGSALGPAFTLSGPAFSAAFSPDGRRLVAGGGALGVNGEIRAWDIATREPLMAPISLRNTVAVAAFLPDGLHVVSLDFSIGGDDTARTWDLATGRQVTQVTLKLNEPDIPGFQRYLSPASGRVLQVQGVTAQVFDALTGKPLGEPVRHKRDVYFALLNPDGKRFATASWEWTLQVWDADTGKAMSPPIPHYYRLTGLKFGPGSHLTAAYWDGSVRSYEIATGKPIFDPRPVAHKGSWRPAFSPDGRFVAVLGHDGSARIWSVISKAAATPALRHSASITDALFSDDGRRLFAACSDGTTRVWDLASAGLPRATLQHVASPGRTIFTADGSRFVTTSLGAATIWNAQTLESLFVCKVATEGTNVCTQLSDDARFLAIGTETGLAQVWETSTGKAVTAPLKQSRSIVHQVAISPDGRYLGILAADSQTVPALFFGDAVLRFFGDAALWDIAAGKPVTPGPLGSASRPVTPGASQLSATLFQALGLTNSLTAATCIAFSPDSRYFAVGGGRIAPSGIIGEAQVYETATGKPVGKVLDLDAGLGVMSLVFSPDSSALALIGRDINETRGQLRVWDFRAAKQVMPPIPFATVPERVVFDPAGRLLLTSNADQVLLWHADSGKPAYPPLKHADRVTLAEFSRDGKFLITACSDNTVCLWEVSTGEPLTPPLKHHADIRGAALHPNGQMLVVACSDNAARVWDLAGPDRADDVARMARLLSCRQVDGAGTTAVADEVLAADWNVLRDKYPGDFAPSKDQLLDWHGRESDACQNLGLWTQGVRHLDRLIELAPERVWYRGQRGHFHALLGHYQQAADDYARGMEADPNNHWNWYCAGCARLALDDRAGYGKLCDEMLRRFRDAKEPFTCERVAKACLLIPGAVADPAPAIELAGRAATADPNNPWFTLANGIAEYRAGRFDQAVIWLDKTCGMKDGKDKTLMYDTLAQLFLAMAHQQLQQPDKARAMLEAARKSLEAAEANSSVSSWISRVHGKVVLQEARGLVQ
jgi:WD40 repeat protein